MFEETLYQKAADGRQFVDILKAQGILPGIKVDTGLQVGNTIIWLVDEGVGACSML
jgi:fructose-bisphosphate aldolase class 1